MKYWPIFVTPFLVQSAMAGDEINTVLSLAGELDDQDSRYYMASLDQRIADETWVSLSASYANLDEDVLDSSSETLGLKLSHRYRNWDLSLGFDYWDAQEGGLISRDVSAGIYYQFSHWSLGGDYVRRDTSLTFRLPTGREFTDELTGNGYGAGVSYAPNDHWFLYTHFMLYDYQGQIVNRPEFDVFSRSIFTADDSLLDQNIIAGVDYYWDLYSLSIYASENRSAFADQSTRIYNLSGKAILSEYLDLQLHLGTSQPESAEDSVYAGLSLYLYW